MKAVKEEKFIRYTIFNRLAHAAVHQYFSFIRVTAHISIITNPSIQHWLLFLKIKLWVDYFFRCAASFLKS